MSEDSFWDTTPRKLHALLRVHKEVNTVDDKPKEGYIDEVIL
jgi:hypothetical protein